ncbi:20281_t:CDS:2, partial [Gigaspora margarita]
IEYCNEVRKNREMVMKKVLLAIVMRIETLDNHAEGVKDQLVKFRFKNNINKDKDTSIEYINMKNNEKSINCLSNTRGAYSNRENAKKIMVKIKSEIILNNYGGIYKLSSQKFIKMYKFSREVHKSKLKGHLDWAN